MVGFCGLLVSGEGVLATSVSVGGLFAVSDFVSARGLPSVVGLSFASVFSRFLLCNSAFFRFFRTTNPRTIMSTMTNRASNVWVNKRKSYRPCKKMARITPLRSKFFSLALLNFARQI